MDGWVDVEKPRAYIAGHWNYQPGTKKNVYVISNAEKVQLFINGKSLGTGEQSNRFLFTFKNVEWQPGMITAVGYDLNGRKITSVAKKTAAQPVALRLSPRTGPAGFRADGADVALVEVEVVDAAGNTCPTALDTVNFSLEGPAEWRGGIAQGPDNFVLAKSLPVENGVNRVIIRSLPQDGNIVLRATAAGLKPASITLVSQPVRVTDGLSQVMPADGLFSNLDRGPTPMGQSFVTTRRPIKMMRTEAGANAENAVKSFDDDETTAWTSDGKLDQGWVRYHFERETTVGEVVLKLAGWRTQSYPVRILVDNKVVFEGNTPRSLGYVTFSFPPVTGRSLRIELRGSASNRDAFGNIIEIPGTPDPQSAADRGGAKGTLSIIEIEIYTPVR